MNFCRRYLTGLLAACTVFVVADVVEALGADAVLAPPVCIVEPSVDSELGRKHGPKPEPEMSAERLLRQHAVPEEEFFIRLIFAESLASNCNRPDSPGQPERSAAIIPTGISQGIAWVLRNRTLRPQAFGVGVKVVTAPKQFRSTFGYYDVSRRKEFLCPQSVGSEWKQGWEQAKAAWTQTSSSTNPIPGVYNYYLGRHFERSALRAKIKHPAWAKSPNEQVLPPLLGLDSRNKCIEFWKVSTASP